MSARFGDLIQVANPNRNGVDWGARDLSLSPDGSRAVALGTGAFFDPETWTQLERFADAGARWALWLPDGRLLTLGASLGELDPATGKRRPLGKVKFAFAPEKVLIRDGVLFGADGVWDGGRPDKAMLRGVDLVTGEKTCAKSTPGVLDVLADAEDAGLFAAWMEVAGADGEGRRGRCGLFDPSKGSIRRAVDLPGVACSGARVGEVVWLGLDDGGIVSVDWRSLAIGAAWAPSEGRVRHLEAWGDLLVAARTTASAGWLELLDPESRAVLDRIELTHPTTVPHPTWLKVQGSRLFFDMHGLFVTPLAR